MSIHSINDAAKKKASANDLKLFVENNKKVYWLGYNVAYDFIMESPQFTSEQKEYLRHAKSIHAADYSLISNALLPDA